MKFAQRIESRQAVHWHVTEKRVQAKQAEGVKVIRLEAGNPDLPIPPAVVEALRQAALDPAYHRYRSSYGTGLRTAVADWYCKRFGVKLDPATEVYPLNGSQAAISSLGPAVMEPGAVALVTDPAYDAYARVTEFGGGEVYHVPIREQDGYLPDLSLIPAEVLVHARLLWLNYPNNPTGAVAPLSFFEQVVTFAREHDILVCHDNAYSEITYDGYTAPSFLQAAGAKEVGVELNSLSKTYNMAGWRVGVAVGNAEAVSKLFQAHQNTIVCLPGPIEVAAVEALTGDQSWMVERNEIYQKRRDIVVKGLRAIGLETPYPQAALYVWARLPEGYRDSRAFAVNLLDQVGVSVTAGVHFGQGGEGYVRLALTVPTDDLRAAMERLNDFKWDKA
jgi:LL-diaminopimelate aminotransferase